jgi:hypothetical protein
MSTLSARTPRPFLQDIRRDKPGAAVARAALVAAKSEFETSDPTAVAVRSFPNDPIVSKLVTRGAVAPASLTGTGWAAELAASTTVDFIGSMTGQSAAAKLIDAGVKLSFDNNRAASINIPARAAAPSADVAWTAELAPMPVLSFTLSALTLTPHKLAACAAASREIVESGNGEQVIGQLLKEDLAYTLDSSMFSATAASTARPAGLLNGLTTLGATTGGGATAMNADIAKLFTSISSAGNADDIAIIASPSQAAALQMQPRSGELRIWSSRALSAGTVVAVDVNGFISAFSQLPRVQASGEALAHFDDAAPAAISTSGSPNVISAPVRSAFQTDCTIVRVFLTASWVVRPGAVAMITSTTW